jgi:hypothetical protein
VKKQLMVPARGLMQGRRPNLNDHTVKNSLYVDWYSKHWAAGLERIRPLAKKRQDHRRKIGELLLELLHDLRAKHLDESKDI